jgi:hypothetical protein
MRLPIILTIASSLALPLAAQAPTEGHDLYNVTMLRAAPGHYPELIEALRISFEYHADAGDGAPFFMRHSQGDQWDFMLIYPMGGLASYHHPDRIRARQEVWGTEPAIALNARIASLTAWQEEWFARSIPLEAMTRRFEGMGLFHIEMFAGLPGKRAELLEQRRMENRYYTHLGRQLNVLFTRAGGPNWDAMTIGFHLDLQAFADAGAQFSSEQQNEAALVAGFESVNTIGPYLRSLLSYHRDTFAVPVN